MGTTQPERCRDRSCNNPACIAALPAPTNGVRLLAMAIVAGVVAILVYGPHVREEAAARPGVHERCPR